MRTVFEKIKQAFIENQKVKVRGSYDPDNDASTFNDNSLTRFFRENPREKAFILDHSPKGTDTYDLDVTRKNIPSIKRWLTSEIEWDFIKNTDDFITKCVAKRPSYVLYDYIVATEVYNIPLTITLDDIKNKINGFFEKLIGRHNEFTYDNKIPLSNKDLNSFLSVPAFPYATDLFSKFVTVSEDKNWIIYTPHVEIMKRIKDHVVSGRIIPRNGKAGTGKTTKTFNELVEENPFQKVTIVTLANNIGFSDRAKAFSSGLMSVDFMSMTKFSFGKNPRSKSWNSRLIVLDEASLIDIEGWGLLCDYLDSDITNNKIIALGDYNQIPSFLSRGTIWYSIISEFKIKDFSETVYRHTEDSYRDSLTILLDSDHKEFIRALKKTTTFIPAKKLYPNSSGDILSDMISAYYTQTKDNIERALFIVKRNVERIQINKEMITKTLGTTDVFMTLFEHFRKTYTNLRSVDDVKTLYYLIRGVEERVVRFNEDTFVPIFGLKNYKPINFFNKGSYTLNLKDLVVSGFGLTEEHGVQKIVITSDSRRVFTPKDPSIAQTILHVNDIDLAYATTIFSSQGLEREYIFFYNVGETVNKNDLYVAMSRAQKRLVSNIFNNESVNERIEDMILINNFEEIDTLGMEVCK